jgi:hypothetical protein
MVDGRIVDWGGELVVELPETVFEGAPPQAVMFDATADQASQSIGVTYSIQGTRRTRSYEPGAQGGKFPVPVVFEITSLGWKRGEAVKATFVPPATLRIFK